MSGVYTITNTVTGKYYVGSTVQVIRKRLLQHRSQLRRGKHYNAHMQHTWNKYGEETFLFEELEECDPEYCIPREQFWVNELRANDRRFGFNLSMVVYPTALGTKWPESRRAQYSARLKGRKVSPEEKARLLSITLGRRPNAETRRKMSEAQRRRKRGPNDIAGILRANTKSRKPVIGECAETGRTVVLESITAAKHHGFLREKVRDCCLGKRKRHAGYTWRYAAPGEK